jgi:hypothetical protein
MQLARDKIKHRRAVADSYVRVGNLIADKPGLGFLVEAEYRKALALDPKHIGAHIGLGNHYAGEGYTEEAEVFYQTALALEAEAAAEAAAAAAAETAAEIAAVDQIVEEDAMAAAPAAPYYHMDATAEKIPPPTKTLSSGHLSQSAL